MNKYFLYFMIFIVSFYSYGNSFCEWALSTERSLIREKEDFYLSAKKIFRHFYVKVKDILPDIEFTELEILLSDTESFTYNRYNRHADRKSYKIAKWKGEKVFLKKIRSGDGEHELAMLRTLNQIGIPTLFKGVVRDNLGDLHIVSQFQAGEVFKTPEGPFTHVNLEYHGLVRKQVDEINFLLAIAHIFPSDFQFMVSKQGEVYLVDVEYYNFIERRAGDRSQIERIKKLRDIVQSHNQ